MSGEVWALAGVVVGAVLGGFAQVMADRLRRRDENASLPRQEQRAAYTELIGAGSSALPQFASDREALKAWAERGSRLADDSVQSMRLGQAALQRLGNAIAAVQLCAPDDTYAAAVRYQHLLVLFLFKDEEGLVEGLVAGQAEFAQLAKRDLTF